MFYVDRKKIEGARNSGYCSSSFSRALFSNPNVLVCTVEGYYFSVWCKKREKRTKARKSEKKHEPKKLQSEKCVIFLLYCTVLELKKNIVQYRCCYN